MPRIDKDIIICYVFSREKKTIGQITFLAGKQPTRLVFYNLATHQVGSALTSRDDTVPHAVFSKAGKAERGPAVV